MKRSPGYPQMVTLLLVVVVLSACIPGLTGKPAVPLTGIDSPTPIPTAVPPQSPLASSLLLSSYDSRNENFSLHLVDPKTGKDTPGYPPFTMGSTFWHSFSPDRKTLALITNHKPECIHTCLVWIDLTTWKTDAIQLDLKLTDFNWFPALEFHPDGETIALAYSNGRSDHRLFLVDILNKTIPAQAPLPIRPSQVRFSGSGNELLVYGSFSEDENEENPVVSALAVSVPALEVVWKVDLDGVKDGLYQLEGKEASPANQFYYTAGTAFDPDASRLYVVHPDSSLLTTVDFKNRQVKTNEVSAARSFLEWILELTAQKVEAKSLNGTRLQAALSPDGSRLYVTGVTDSLIDPDGGSWEVEQIPYGLRIIDTGSHVEIKRLDTVSNEFRLDREGNFLYMYGWGDSEGIPVNWTEIYNLERDQVEQKVLQYRVTPSHTLGDDPILISTTYLQNGTTNLSILDPSSFRPVFEQIDSSTIPQEWVIIP